MNQKKTQTKKATPKKRKLPQLSYSVRRLSDYQTITNLKKTKMFVFVNLLGAIQDGLEGKQEQVALLQLKGSKTSVMLNKSDWKGSLTKAMEFFSEHEMYESCQKCKDLIDTL